MFVCHEENWFYRAFFCGGGHILSQRGIRVILVLWDEFGSILSLSVLWNSLRSIGIHSLVLAEFGHGSDQSWACPSWDTFFGGFNPSPLIELLKPVDLGKLPGLQ